MASFIFNDLLQSPLKDIARGTQNFLGKRPFPLQFGLQILERIMRSSVGLALEDGPHRKLQRIQVRAPWGPVFLADERRDVGLNPPLGHCWAMWGRRVLLEGPRCSLEALSGPWQQFTSQNVRDVPLAVQFHSWGLQNEGRSSSGCDGRPNHNRGWILASTHSPAFHGCILQSFWWLTHCSTLNFFSSENTKLGSMPSSMRFRSCRHLSTLIRSCVGVSSWRFCIL